MPQRPRAHDATTSPLEPSPLPRSTSESGPLALLVVAPPEHPLIGRRFPLGSAPLRIGRATSNDVVIEGVPSVSREHCRVERRDAGAYIIDAGSRHGTFVNNARISEAPLQPGDLIQTGGSAFRLVDPLAVRALDSLDQRASRPSFSERSQQLPFPLVALGAVLPSRVDAIARVNCLLEWIGVALRFLVALEVSWLRECQSPTIRAAAVKVVAEIQRGRPITLGAWQSLAWELAALVPADAPAWATAVGRTLASNGRPSSQSNRLAAAVTLRNRAYGHGLHPTQAIAADHERLLQELVDDLLAGLRPLACTRLVTLCRSLGAVGRGVRRDQFWCHDGSGTHPVIERDLPTSVDIVPSWSYLLGEAGDPPLLLAPFVAAVPCAQCPTLEVVLAQRWVIGNQGTPVELLGPVTAHAVSCAMPFFSQAADDFHEAVLRPAG